MRSSTLRTCLLGCLLAASAISTSCRQYVWEPQLHREAEGQLSGETTFVEGETDTLTVADQYNKPIQNQPEARFTSPAVVTAAFTADESIANVVEFEDDWVTVEALSVGTTELTVQTEEYPEGTTVDLIVVDGSGLNSSF